MGNKPKKQQQPTPKQKKPQQQRPEREDPNGPFAPKATTANLDPTKCIAARLGAVGNEKQCSRDRVDGDWCRLHGPTYRAAVKAANIAVKAADNQGMAQGVIYYTQETRVVDEIAMHYDSIKARLQQGVAIGLDELITGSPTGTSWLLQQLHQDFPNSRIKLKLPGEPNPSTKDS